MLTITDKRFALLCSVMFWLEGRPQRTSRIRRSNIRSLMRLQSARRREMYSRQFQEILVLTLALTCVLSSVLPTRICRPRQVWTYPRSGHWWEEIVPGFNRRQWIENFRMSKESFMQIVDQLQHLVEKQDTRLRKAIDVERRVACVIWTLATNSGYRTVGHLFGISQSSISNIMRDVCFAIVKILQPRLIKVPTGETLRTIIEEFEARWGFPQVAGAIDGSHIPIIRPHEYHTDYFNRKHFYSVVLQGVVDYRYCFWDVNIGWPGSVHDARVLANSEMFKKGEEGNLFPAWYREIDGVQVPVLLLGDPAYPLMSWLMKPYLDNGHLTREQKSFNFKLSRARMVVENAFGRLKGRWRILLKRLDCQIDFVPVIIGACCTLHNFCEISGEGIDDQLLSDLDEAVEQPEIENGEVQEGGAGTEVRNALKNHLTS